MAENSFEVGTDAGAGVNAGGEDGLFSPAALELKLLLMKYAQALEHQEEERYADAFRIYSQVLPSFLRIYGDMHPTTLDCKTKAAISLCHMNKYEDGLKLFTEVTEANKRIHGLTHKYTLAAMVNMASARTLQCHYDEALEINFLILELAAENDSNSNKGNSPTCFPKRIDDGVMLAKYGIASVLVSQKRFKEALELLAHLQGLVDPSSTYGPANFLLFRIRSSIAIALVGMGDRQQGILLADQIFNELRKFLPPQHYKVIWAKRVCDGLRWNLPLKHAIFLVARQSSGSCENEGKDGEKSEREYEHSGIEQHLQNLQLQD